MIVCYATTLIYFAAFCQHQINYVMMLMMMMMVVMGKQVSFRADSLTRYDNHMTGAVRFADVKPAT